MINEAPITLAYIDPGTGSMLFTILLGLLSVAVYSFKSILSRISTFSFNENRKSDHYPFVIYTDSKRYWNVFKPICDRFEKNGLSLKYLTQSEDDPVFKEEYRFIEPEYIGNENKAFSKLNLLSADVFLSTTPSLDVYQWKRSKNVKYYIHIPHACSDITQYRIFGIDYYDAILLSGQFQIDEVRELERKRKLPAKDLKIVGLTYFDEMKERLDETKKKKNEIPVVLLAPSWGPNSVFRVFGTELIDRLIDTGYKIIIRPHPQSFISEKKMMDDLMNKYPDIEWNTDNDNFEVLNRSDIMISDFSGVIFDFALVFNKPIIYTANDFDDSVYDCHWIDEKMWTLNTLPKIGEELTKENYTDIKAIIDRCLKSRKYKEGRKKAVEESWNEIGNAADNIFSYMVEKQKELSGDKR